MTAAAYARFSTEHQCSIDVQFAKISKYCNKHNLSLSDQHMYSDEALSGMHVRKRRGFLDLMNAAESHEIDCVVLYDITRGSRDVENWLHFRKRMMALNIPVYSVMDRIGNLDNPTDFLTEILTVSMGQTHVLTSRAKSMDKIDYLAKQGKFCGGYAPFGYQIEDGQYIIIPSEAEIISQIFTLYASGHSYSDIIDSLPAGLRGRRGRPFGKNTIHTILKNERYAGTYSWCKRKVKYMTEWAGGGASERAVTIPDAIPAIIDKETWKKVQLRMESNTHNKMNKSRQNRVYLLSGLIRCGHCGGAMSGVTTINKKGYEYKFYSCCNKRRLRNCKAKNIAANDIEPLVVNLVKQSLLDKSLVEATADAILSVSQNNKSTDLLKGLQKELAQTDEKIQNFVQAIASGITNPSVLAGLSEQEAKKRVLEEKIRFAEPAAPITREAIIKQLSNDIAVLEQDPSAIAQIIRRYVVAIDVYDDHIDIHTTADLARAAEELSHDENIDIKKVYAADHSVNDVNTDGCGGWI